MNILITVPVYNEEKRLKSKIVFLNNFLKKSLSYNYTIEIVDNASKDNTKKIARALSDKYKHINALFLKKQGKGHAIISSWKKNAHKYDVLSFMDLDLSTDLSSFNSLINPIVKESYDVSIGSRYEHKSIVRRSFKRSFFAKAYLLFQKILFNIDYKDSQCGFKAIKPKVFLDVHKYFFKKRFKFDKTDMFFDTQLLILASKLNYKIKSVPVKWDSGDESKVKVLRLVFIFFIYLIYFRFYLFLKNSFK